MADLLSILQDPNFVNANAATKQAIFDKFSAHDTRFTGANTETQDAIRKRFGVGASAAPEVPEVPETPSTPAGQIPIDTRLKAPAALDSTGGLLRRITPTARALDLVQPTVEALGSIGGAALGTALGPLGSIGGAGLGYGLAKGGMRTVRQALGYEAPQTATNALVSGAEDVAFGSTMDAVGRKIIGPAIGKVGEYVSKVRNVKLDAYRAATEGKTDDIVNALRSPNATITPGSAPMAGEVAAPVGATRLAALQDRVSKLPAAASEYASAAAQSNMARIAQQGRVDQRIGGVAQAVQGRIDAGLAQTPPEMTGRALTEIAEGSREVVKKTITGPAYDKAFNAGGEIKSNVDSLVATAEKILERPLSKFDPSTAPQTVRALLIMRGAPEEEAAGTVGKAGFRVTKRAVDEAPAMATLRELDDLRKAVNSDIHAAMTQNSGGVDMRLRNLGKLHAAIDDAVQSSTTLPDNAKTLYQAAIDTYRREYVPKFKVGVNANMFRQTSVNDPRIKPEDVIGKYFQPKGTTEAEQFLTLFGKDAQAKKIAQAGIEDLYLREAGASVTPKTHEAFMRKFADPIRVLQAGGMDVATSLTNVARDAARLEHIGKIAAASGNKLAPPLPPGTNALAVQNRIDELTRNMTPQQLSAVDTVRKDLLRSAEYDRLVKAGSGHATNEGKLATTMGKEFGLPAPGFLLRSVTLVNAVVKRLTMHMDEKLALEMAREMTSPVITADMISKAAQLPAQRAATNALNQTRGLMGTRAAAIGARQPDEMRAQ